MLNFNNQIISFAHMDNQPNITQETPISESSIETNNPIKKEVGMFGKARNIFIIYILIGIVAGLTFVLGVIYLATSNKDDADLVSREEKQLILSEIIKNNPKSLIELPQTENNTGLTPVNSQLNDSSSESTNDALTNIGQVTLPKKAPIPLPKLNEDGTANLDPIEGAIPDLNIYNYRESTIEIIGGPAYNTCGQIPAYGQKEGIFRNVEYFDKDRSYYRSTVNDQEGNLTSYYIGKYGKQENEIYYSNGGTLVVNNKYKINPSFSNENRINETISYPTSGPASLVNDVASYPISYVSTKLGYYTDSYRLIDIIKEDGDSYYILEVSYEVNCNFPSAQQNKNTVINRLKVNVDTFEIVESSTYLNEVEENKRIQTTKHSSTRKKVSFDEVEDEFNIESFACDVASELATINLACTLEAKVCSDGSEVGRDSAKMCAFDFCESEKQYVTALTCEKKTTANIVTLDYSNYVYNKQDHAEEVVSTLEKNDQNIIVPSQDFSIGYNSVKGLFFKDFDFVGRRDFYTVGTVGDKTFSQVLEDRLKNPEVSYDLSINNKYYFIKTYKADLRNVEDILEELTSSYDAYQIEESEDTVNIDGNNVEAKLLKATYAFDQANNQTVSYPSSYPNSYPNIYTSTYHFWLIEYGGNIYVIQAYNNSIDQFDSLTFITAQPDIAETRELLINNTRY